MLTPTPTPAPDDDPAPAEPTLDIAPRSGTAGADVRLTARGFDAGERVGIGFGPPQSEYEIVAHATADASGDVASTVRVPDWAEAGRDYLFVAVPEGPGEKAISSTFSVEASGSGDRVEVTGTVAEVSICQQGTTISVENISDAG